MYHSYRRMITIRKRGGKSKESVQCSETARNQTRKSLIKNFSQQQTNMTKLKRRWQKLLMLLLLFNFRSGPQEGLEIWGRGGGSDSGKRWQFHGTVFTSIFDKISSPVVVCCSVFALVGKEQHHHRLVASTGCWTINPKKGAIQPISSEIPLHLGSNSPVVSD